MAKVTEITVWTRGVVMDKEARDIANTNRPIDYMLKFIPNADVLGAIATVDADGISGIRTVDFSGSEGGVDASGIGAGIAAPILGAMAKVTGMVKKENLAKIISDVAAMERGFNEVKIQKFRKARAEYFWGG
jgi:oxalate oxidoreductase subunit delta